jgi:hypothetical protein
MRTQNQSLMLDYIVVCLEAISKMPNSPISASGLNRNNKRIQGVEGSWGRGVEGSSDFNPPKNS